MTTQPISNKLLQHFNSDFERKITVNFVKCGLETNRVVALCKAITVIATSGILVFTHTVGGLLKGVVFLTQGDVQNAFSEATGGLFNSSSSLYNILRVTYIALHGLVLGYTAFSEMVNQPAAEALTPPAIAKPNDQAAALENQNDDLKKLIETTSEAIKQVMTPAMERLTQELVSVKAEMEQLTKTYEISLEKARARIQELQALPKKSDELSSKEAETVRSTQQVLTEIKSLAKEYLENQELLDDYQQELQTVLERESNLKAELDLLKRSSEIRKENINPSQKTQTGGHHVSQTNLT